MVKLQKTILARHRKQHKKKTNNPFLCLDFLSPEFLNSIEDGQSCFGALLSIFLFLCLIILSVLILRADIYENVKYPVSSKNMENGLNVTVEMRDVEKKITDFPSLIQIIGKDAQKPCSSILGKP